MNIIKKNYKFIIILILILLLFNIKFPYYIDAPGGITDISNKIEIEGYDSKGSFNLAYVKEYRASIPTLLISLFNKDYKIIKQEEILLDSEDNSSYETRDKILMNEGISNAIYVAYTKANKKIDIIDNNVSVIHILKDANTNLIPGDSIISINNNVIKYKTDITNILDNLNTNKKINIKVINNNKEYNRYAYIDKDKKIGILIANICEYKTDPKVEIKTDKKESGSSGGLITALSIYNSLVSKDITKGKTIVGTGTIDLNGNVGSIGGVAYKLKSAVKAKADIFIVPNDENYDEAIKIKKENNYDIDIIGVSTFDDALDYLNSID